jgi:hypothetical protein
MPVAMMMLALYGLGLFALVALPFLVVMLLLAVM